MGGRSRQAKLNTVQVRLEKEATEAANIELKPLENLLSNLSPILKKIKLQVVSHAGPVDIMTFTEVYYACKPRIVEELVKDKTAELTDTLVRAMKVIVEKAEQDGNK